MSEIEPAKSHSPNTASPHATSIEEVLSQLGSDPKQGLSPSSVNHRLEQHGHNELREAPGVPAWRKFLRQFTELVVLILIAAALISGILGDWLDAMAITAIVLINGLFGFIQEERAEQALSALRKLSSPEAKTVRDGIPQSVPARDLVPGDIIELEAGDNCPADARLLESYNCTFQEAPLTGESLPSKKNPDTILGQNTPLGDRINMGFMGTDVVTGRCRGVVTATGMQTQLGQIAGMLEHYEPEPTPLQRRLQELGKVLVVVCLFVVGVIFGLEIFRGGSLIEVFLLSVSLAVAAVPEGLPAAVTISLALGLRRMVKRNALVRTLPSVETLGSVTVICSDKTGTLTCNEMTVRQILTGSQSYQVTGAGYTPSGEFLPMSENGNSGTTEKMEGAEDPAVVPSQEPDLYQALTIGARCNNAQLAPDQDSDQWQVIGDPTEGALLVAARKAGIGASINNQALLHEIPFDAQRKLMSVVIGESPERATLYTKGAAEVVLSKCSAELRGGAIRALDSGRREELLASAAEMASQSLRVLGLAYRQLSQTSNKSFQERDLVFGGLVGMIDPPRPEAKRAVESCRKAGIHPVMITGDHPSTALAVAHELGIASKDEKVITGVELDRLSERELRERVESISAYARVSPEHKLRIIRGWKSHGHIVAMTGDGVNDAPAVKAADIGVAMGVTGTDVTKQVSDMVLVDDNFASIVSAVEEGRGIYDNIQKFVQYLLSCNAGEILLMFFAALMGWPAPLAAIQILWINLVTDGVPALALAVEPPERDIMLRNPRHPKEPVVSYQRGTVMVLHGLLIAAAGSVAFAWIYSGDTSALARAKTATFCVVAFSQLFYSLSCRSLKHTMPELGLFSNPYLWGAIAISSLLQLGAVNLPFAQPVFEATSLTISDWWLVLGLALTPVTLIEVVKLLRNA